MHQFLGKTNNFDFFGPSLPKMDLGSEIQKSKNQHREDAMRANFEGKTNNFDFFGLNLPKNAFWGRSFKNLSLNSESPSLRYYVYRFTDKTDKFESLGPNLPKSGIWGRNFKICKILVQILLRVLQRAEWRLKWAGWRWMELGGAGWSWVELGSRFSNTLFKF